MEKSGEVDEIQEAFKKVVCSLHDMLLGNLSSPSTGGSPSVSSGDPAPSISSSQCAVFDDMNRRVQTNSINKDGIGNYMSRTSSAKGYL